MNTSELLIFIFGSLIGASGMGFFAILIHLRRVQSLCDEFAGLRETIRRYAYARGYEAARAGEVKRS